AGALRELCDRYGVSADRDGSGGYLLHHHGDPASAAAARPVGLVEQDGTRLQVHSVSVYGNRSASFIGSAPELSNGGMRVQLQARVAEGEGGSIAGVRNVTARDDRGNQLAFLPGTGAWPFASDGTSRLPDEWSGAISFEAPDPRAKRIAALEGELMEYRSVRPLRIEVPLPLEQSTVRAEEGGLTLAVSRYRVLSATEPETGDELLPLPGTAGDSSDSGPTVRVRLFVPTGARYSDRSGTSALAPVLVGSSGKSYPAQQLRAGGGRSSATVAMQDTTWIFPGVTEEPRSLVWEIVEKKDPVRRFKFRMTDIPLPGPASLGSQGGRSVFIAP
ncbi:MAG: hypothetical protein K0Q72_2640, partial [Armatimonadetes bacterium]|nr:hypothetical protein [Armatimonadota bacterium]